MLHFDPCPDAHDQWLTYINGMCKVVCARQAPVLCVSDNHKYVIALRCNRYVPSVSETTYSHSFSRKYVLHDQRSVGEWPPSGEYMIRIDDMFPLPLVESTSSMINVEWTNGLPLASK